MSEIAIPLSDHAVQWQYIQAALVNQRMPQALLLVGPRHVKVTEFATRLASILLCHAKTKPCYQCSSCHLFQAGTHSDFKWIRPETSGGVIKIDQVRSLQEEIYHTPHCGDNKVILIDEADRMNVAAANALLKILEEPPLTVYFILVAELFNTIPATILSRCQKMIFADSKFDASSYVTLGSFYDADSSRGKLYAMRHSIVALLCDLIEGKASPCTVAASWGTFELPDVIWFLHLITAQAIQSNLAKMESEGDDVGIRRLIELSHPIGLFMQLDNLSTISKKLSHNTSMNATLVLEDLLIGYYRNRYG